MNCSNYVMMVGIGLTMSARVAGVNIEKALRSYPVLWSECPEPFAEPERQNFADGLNSVCYWVAFALGFLFLSGIGWFCPFQLVG